VWDFFNAAREQNDTAQDYSRFWSLRKAGNALTSIALPTVGV